VKAPACPSCGLPQIPRPGRPGVLACVHGHGLPRRVASAPVLRKALPFEGDAALIEIKAELGLLPLGEPGCKERSPSGRSCQVEGPHIEHEARDNYGLRLETWWGPFSGGALGVTSVEARK